MSVKIGNGNKIKNSIIAENVSGKEKDTFFNRHPVICSLFISFVIGFLFLFSFWKDVVAFIEGVF